MKTFASLLLLMLPLSAQCQGERDSVSPFRLFPSGLAFAPLKASSQEPRMGLLKFLNTAEMVVDIGNASEIVEFVPPASDMRVALGIEFFGKAFVTGAQGLRLQVDAMDGFFGGHLSWSNGSAPARITARLRILHQSAHFVDGHIGPDGTWLANRTPIPFTRDFGELTLGQSLRYPSGSARYYGGFSYATLVRPADVQRLAYLGGFEITLDGLFGSILGETSHLYCAYHISLNGTPVYAASNQIQAGVKIGEWLGRGTDFYVAWYDGRHLFGEYFNERLTALGAGFMVDFY